MLENFISLDFYIYNHFHNFFSVYPEIIKLFEKITFFGSYNFVIYFLVFIFILLLFLNKSKKNYLVLLTSVLLTTVTVTILKNIFMRLGPGNRILYETDFSFPSGHAATSVALFAIIYFLITKNFKLSNFYKKFYLFIIIIIIFLISISRLILGVHYLSDILAGILIGYVGFVFGKIVYNKMK